MRENIANIRQRWATAKLTKTKAFWVAIVAIVLTLFWGFSSGGWMTGGSATQMAEKVSKVAVVERLTPICVMQFNEDPQRDQKLEELKALNSTYQQSSYIKEQGWATMPGEKMPDGSVANECLKQLELIDK